MPQMLGGLCRDVGGQALRAWEDLVNARVEMQEMHVVVWRGVALVRLSVRWC
jgi:hypothetical protein